MKFCQMCNLAMNAFTASPSPGAAASFRSHHSRAPRKRHDSGYPRAPDTAWCGPAVPVSRTEDKTRIRGLGDTPLRRLRHWRQPRPAGRHRTRWRNATKMAQAASGSIRRKYHPASFASRSPGVASWSQISPAETTVPIRIPVANRRCSPYRSPSSRSGFSEADAEPDHGNITFHMIAVWRQWIEKQQAIKGAPPLPNARSRRRVWFLLPT